MAPVSESNGSKVPEIPFELVDDDEMAAIEKALLHANSVSSAYHSIRTAFTLGGANSGQSHSARSSSDLGLGGFPKIQMKDSFMYAVLSSASLIADSDSAVQSGFTVDVRSKTSSLSSAVDAVSSQSPQQESRSSPSASAYSSVSDSCFPVSSSVDENSHFLTGDHSASQGRGSGDVQDMEDLGAVRTRASSGNGTSGSLERAVVTLLQRKSKRGLAVTDFTASEWCEKQVEFSLNRGKPERTPAMKAGSIRHVELEKEVVTRVEIDIRTKEDTWAVRLLNFITGARQLLSEGLTRELPVLGVVGGTWVVGIIDEIRLVKREGVEQPLLVDTKTRKRQFLPSEPQKRNARLQLMCYKMLWDSMVQCGLPSESFLRHFGLNPLQAFCQEVKTHVTGFWDDYEVQCLQDLIPQIQKEIRSQIYPRSMDTLLLRYEWQADQSLLGEDEFYYEHDWLMDRWKWHLEFWKGDRAASLVPEDESWKCRFCSFASVCLPAQQPVIDATRQMEVQGR